MTTMENTTSDTTPESLEDRASSLTLQAATHVVTDGVRSPVSKNAVGQEPSRDVKVLEAQLREVKEEKCDMMGKLIQSTERHLADLKQNHEVIDEQLEEQKGKYQIYQNCLKRREAEIQQLKSEILKLKNELLKLTTGIHKQRNHIDENIANELDNVKVVFSDLFDGIAALENVIGKAGFKGIKEALALMKAMCAEHKD